MLSKTMAVERYLLERIAGGVLAPHARIPSQQQLMSRCGCSRTTVIRAVNNLIRSGHIRSRKGSGSFVRPGPYSNGIREIVIVGENSENSPRYPFSEMLFSLNTGTLPVHWIDNRFALDNAEHFFMPGQAVIWLLPSESQILLMRYLKDKGLPQLLINRRYEEFDNICTDAREGLREGLAWLLIEAGRDIAFISHAPDSRRPYLDERIIAFYETCFETGANLAPKALFKLDFSKLAERFDDIGRQLFDSDRIPRGIFVMNYELVVPTVLCASRYGLTLGKDYFLLTFDMVPELSGQKGIAMMRQPLRFFRQGIEQWLQLADSPERDRFELRRKTDLIVC